MATVAERLRTAGAHNDLVQWATGFGDDAATLVQQCPRADWLLAIAARAGVDRKALVASACACAQEALSYLSDPAPQLTASLSLASSWVQGHGSETACAEAAGALEALPMSGDAVTDAAAQAVLAALTAVREPEAAAHAAACAAHAAVLSAGDCAMESALRFTQERCAKLVREALPSDSLVAWLRGSR